MKSFITKILIISLFITTVISPSLIVNAVEVYEFGGGSGTEADPWRISTPEHLDNLRNYLGSEHSDKHFILINDLDLSEYLSEGGAGYHDGAGWEPIVDWVPDIWGELRIVSFYGNLNGNGYKISNLYINRPDTKNVGLFGSIRDAQIISLELENVNITGSRYVGGLTGAASGETDIINSYVTGNVNSIGSSGSSYVGGLVGDFIGNGVIKNSFFIGNISGTNYTGGLAGEVYNSGGTISIINSYAKAIVNGGNYTGGLFGYTYGSQIENAFFTGEVVGNSEVGGIAGRGYNVSISGSFIEGNITGNGMVGGLIGSQTASSSGSSILNSYVKGDVIGSAEKVGGLLGRQYVFSGGTSIVSDSYAVGMVSGASLTGGLIGSQEESGSKLISNSYYNSEIAEQSDTDRGTPKTTVEMQEQSTYVGWDFTDAWGIESDRNDGYPYLKSSIVTIASPESGGTTLVTGSFIQGEQVTVTAAVYSGYKFSHWTEDGEIISRNLEYSFYTTGNRILTVIFGSYEIVTTANPTAGGYVTGGAVYNPGASVTVSASAATGYTFVNWTEEGTEVSTEANYSFTADKDRSLVANFFPNEYMISANVLPADSGTVTGTGSYYHGDNVTLTAAANDEYTFVNWTEDGMEVGTEASYSFIAGEERTLTANFAKYEITTNVNPGGSGNTIGDTWANEGENVTVTAVANSGYSFTNWTENGIVVSTEQEYTFTVSGDHHLTANFDHWYGGGTGTENDPYIVETAEHLNNIRKVLDNPSVYFVQTADINLQGLWAEGEGWEPIGNEWKNRFRGQYDGNGYKILNLTINRPDESYVGLFGHLGSGAEVKNIQLEEVNITGRYIVGALAGTMENGNIENSHVSGNISGNNAIGGLVGTNYSGTIQSSSSKGVVTGTDLDDGRGIAYNTGGLVGLNDGTVEESFSEVNVYGTNNVGGLAGSNESPKTIINSYATGNVSGTNRVGGLIGFNTKTVINSYAVGTVAGTENVGGLIGSNSYGTVENSYYDSQTSGQDDDTGKGIPLTSLEMKLQGTFTDAGWNFDDIWIINPLQNDEYPILRWQDTRTYAVIYDGNGNTGGTVPIDNNSYKEGAKVTILGNIGSLTKTGYTFEGWNTVNNGTGTSYSQDDILIIGTSDVTLFAQWKAKPTSYQPQPPAIEDSSDDVIESEELESIGTSTTETKGGQTVTTISVDTEKLEQILKKEGNNAIVSIQAKTGADVVISELNGQMIKDMAAKQAVLEVITETAIYTLPAQAINIDALSSQLEKNVKLEDIKIQIEIVKSPKETVKLLEDAAQEDNFTILAQPMEFIIKGIYSGITLEVNKFSTYVERKIAIPSSDTPNKNITGIVLESDGTVRHVPTKVVEIEGEYYAKINSLTNSIYSVIWYQQEFSDVENHWAQEAINDMGSRMVVNGVSNNLFEPEREITRAEFATIIVRALGLKPGLGNNIFTDVSDSDWYSDYIKTAVEYNLITGYGNGKFGPMDKITREQAMTMVARAMEITGLDTELTDGEIEQLLLVFTDASLSAEYAKSSIAICVKNEIVSGRTSNLIAPKDNITRAEVAVIVKRLLQNSNLI